MAKAFEILYDLYCFVCSNFTPIVATNGVAANFSFDSDSGATGNGTLTGVTAVISDGSTETAVLAGTSGTFSHTFTNAGVYTIKLVAAYSDTIGTSECDTYTITVS